MNQDARASHSTLRAPSGAALATFAIVAASSILFCSKGVFVKLAYAHGAGTLSVLALRMGMSLPFFLAIAIWHSRGAEPLKARDWAQLAGLGFLGYYVSSLVNFLGLQYVSVGLERIVLYTYPSIVLLISAFVLRKAVRPLTWGACAVAWLGIVAAFIGETHTPQAGAHTGLGAALIFASAVTYALFILMSGSCIRRVGSMRFTGIAGSISCILILLHTSLAQPVRTLFALPTPVYIDGAVLALLGTVAPVLLLAIGLQRTGPQQFAIIGTVGPVTTVFLAWFMLGEAPNAIQALGFALTLGGGLAVSLLKSEPAPSKPAASGAGSLVEE